MTTTKQGARAIHIDLTRLENDSGNPGQLHDGSLNVKKRFNGWGS